MPAFIGLPGGSEIWIVAVVVLVLFGAGAIPKFARSIGRAKGEFEKGARDGASEEPADGDDSDTEDKDDIDS